MSIMTKIRQSVKLRFAEKGNTKNLQKPQNPALKKSKSRELYTDNEDLGFC